MVIVRFLTEVLALGYKRWVFFCQIWDRPIREVKVLFLEGLSGDFQTAVGERLGGGCIERKWVVCLLLSSAASNKYLLATATLCMEH